MTLNSELKEIKTLLNELNSRISDLKKMREVTRLALSDLKRECLTALAKSEELRKVLEKK